MSILELLDPDLVGHPGELLLGGPVSLHLIELILDLDVLLVDLEIPLILLPLFDLLVPVIVIQSEVFPLLPQHYILHPVLLALAYGLLDIVMLLFYCLGQLIPFHLNVLDILIDL